MPNSDYVSSGGGLKLKGVKDGGVKKSKKKKVKKIDAGGDGDGSLVPQKVEKVDAEVSEEEVAHPVTTTQTAKTEAERKHEEMRRKRVSIRLESHDERLTQSQLEERLKREGTKTHKERVEEFNKYLSTLSEHHDMYDFLCGSGIINEY